MNMLEKLMAEAIIFILFHIYKKVGFIFNNDKTIRIFYCCFIILIFLFF